MVQRKAINNKPTTFNKASPSLFEAVKKPSINMKPSIQILDNKAKGTDLAKKMKKSRSFKRSPDLDNIKKCSLRRYQLPSPTNDQTPQKQSPNYMKSTSSSEARKEKNQVLFTKTPTKSGIESTSKRLFSSSSCSTTKSVSRISSLRKVRTLTKAPSFKPSRSIKSTKKCSKTSSLYDVKRNTCSSTIKDSKFPSFLDLSPQGTSIMKVCPYSYCSLNGHRHTAAPPLKSFLCAKRRMMKAQRSLKPVYVASCKVKPYLDDDNQGKEVVDASIDEEKAEFFLEIYADKDEDGLKQSLDQEKEKLLEDVVVDESVYDVASFDWESSDMEWDDEDMIFLTGFELEDGEITPSDHEKDQNTKGNEIEYLLDEGSLKKDDVNMEFLKEFLAEELSQDEIIDCHEQLSDSDSSMNDSYDESELDQFFQALEDEKTEDFPALKKEKTEDFPVIDGAVEDPISLIHDMENSGFAKEDCCDEVEEEEEEKTEEEEEESKASENANKNNKERGKGEISSECSNMISITKGKRNIKEDSEEMKAFNPREPNFLEIEPDLDSEKVDLKHQEMDERRNSEEFMLDFALRKAVDHLAPARKKKVALLVAAFETVIPPPAPPARRLQPCN
ncbi:hypothetical protein V2J09_012494 [Rumex salicifolius]